MSTLRSWVQSEGDRVSESRGFRRGMGIWSPRCQPAMRRLQAASLPRSTTIRNFQEEYLVMLKWFRYVVLAFSLTAGLPALAQQDFVTVQHLPHVSNLRTGSFIPMPTTQRCNRSTATRNMHAAPARVVTETELAQNPTRCSRGVFLWLFCLRASCHRARQSSGHRR